MLARTLRSRLVAFTAVLALLPMLPAASALAAEPAAPCTTTQVETVEPPLLPTELLTVQDSGCGGPLAPTPCATIPASDRSQCLYLCQQAGCNGGSCYDELWAVCVCY